MFLFGILFKINSLSLYYKLNWRLKGATRKKIFQGNSK